MKYVKNNAPYSLAFSAGEGVAVRRFSFPTFRVYSDTGNVASTGVTELSDADYDFLCTNCAQFKKMVESGKFTLVSREEAIPNLGKVESLESENKQLKKQLAEAKKQVTASSDDKEAEKLRDENASLKAQLEALKKQSKAKKTAKAETQADNGGF